MYNMLVKNKKGVKYMELGANLYVFNRAGDTSPPILHADKGSWTQSSYYGSGRQETDSFEGSTTQVLCSLPAQL